ncbi:MAG: hypothetical protein J7K75_01135 [Desulfuromonas sp.]|nr:hypothetical protein [Desulfuromonas sp.]
MEHGILLRFIDSNNISRQLRLRAPAILAPDQSQRINSIIGPITTQKTLANVSGQVINARIVSPQQINTTVRIHSQLL